MLSHTKYLLSIIVSLAVIAGCSKSDAQQEFEEQAFSQPSGITEMTVNGNPVPGANDPDDWRAGPMFQGFIEVATPAFPNPVNINSTVRIDIDIKGFESIQGLEVFVFRNVVDDLVGPIFSEDPSSLSPGIHTIVLDPAQFAGSGSNFQQVIGLNRILIFDFRDNLITYGDIEVQ